jgi:hypothetical protein
MTAPRRVNVGWLAAAAALLVTAFVAFGLSSGSCTTSPSGVPTCSTSKAPGAAAVLALGGAGYCLYRGLRRRS